MSVQTIIIEYLITAIVASGPIVALMVASRKIGVLNAASWLVVWGSIFVIAEHTSFTEESLDVILSMGTNCQIFTREYLPGIAGIDMAS